MQPQNWPTGERCTCKPHNEPTTDDIRASELRSISRIPTNLHWSFHFCWSLSLLWTKMLHNHACGMLAVLFWILRALKRANCEPSPVLTPRHCRRRAACSSSLIETFSITNGSFDYKRDEWTLKMESKISTIFFYLTTGFLNKSILSLILLLNKHTLIISITLPVSSKNGRRPGHHHLIKPGIA
jgi:hypothetical protein